MLRSDVIDADVAASYLLFDGHLALYAAYGFVPGVIIALGESLNLLLLFEVDDDYWVADVGQHLRLEQDRSVYEDELVPG